MYIELDYYSPPLSGLSYHPGLSADKLRTLVAGSKEVGLLQRVSYFTCSTTPPAAVIVESEYNVALLNCLSKSISQNTLTENISGSNIHMVKYSMGLGMALAGGVHALVMLARFYKNKWGRELIVQKKGVALNDFDRFEIMFFGTTEPGSSLIVACSFLGDSSNVVVAMQLSAVPLGFGLLIVDIKIVISYVVVFMNKSMFDKCLFVIIEALQSNASTNYYRRQQRGTIELET
ncbi:hypothetical protein ACFE04_004673 [Oxalis oulophora]